VRAAIVLVLCAACIEVSPEHHCTMDGDCNTSKTTGRCEPTGHCSFLDVDHCGDQGFRYDERSGAHAGVCVTRAPLLVPVDFTADTVTSSCGAAGARDTQVEIISTTDQVLIADTIGVATTLALRDGPCPSVDPAELGCSATPCGAQPYGQLIATLDAGHLYCLIVEESAPNAVTASFELRVLLAGTLATPLATPTGDLAGNTCGQPPTSPSSCGPPASTPAAAFLLPLCGGNAVLRATVDPAAQPAPLDAVVSLREALPTGAEVDCANDATDVETLTSVPLTGPGVYWLMVSGATTDCGPFSLSYAVTPN